jgi:drug/metabolite transporter (DMT)-like permease
MKITPNSMLASFGPAFAAVVGILLLSYGFIEPHRPWFIAGSILLAAGIIAARIRQNNVN